MSPSTTPALTLGLNHIWSTHVAFAAFDAERIVTSALTERLATHSETYTALEAPEYLTDATELSDRFAWAASSILGLGSPTACQIQLSLELWGPGYEAPVLLGAADATGWAFLLGSPADHSDAGTVAVIDPRAGSNMVPVPGMPWGRPLVVAPVPGTLTTIPSWLMASVLPLDPNQRIALVRADIRVSDSRAEDLKVSNQ